MCARRVKAIFVALGILLAAGTARAQQVDYATQIKPLLTGRCFACHSALRQKGGLRLDTAAMAKAGGDSGAVIVPGNAADSLLLARVLAGEDERMPPKDEGEALKPDQVALLRTWIEQGAPAPADEPTPRDPRDHWAFQPPVKPQPPAPTNAAWVRNPIDAFLAAEHESHGLVPASPAAKNVLLRRVYFDLIGLPPTREELNAFLADESPTAYEAVVDRLLASPRYGERWGRHWMDVWRYSDWAGFGEQIRESCRHIWHWRDWIVESVNADKGYDRMVVEMLAGDELAPTDDNTLRATGYLARSWYKFNRNTWLENTVEHTAKAFLGLTVNCAKCHDHKYDPIAQTEYYQLRAIFEPYDVRTDRVAGEADVMKAGLPRAIDLKAETPTYLFKRGLERLPDTSNPIPPLTPAVLGGKLEIAPVELPLEAYYPGIKAFSLADDIKLADDGVKTAQAALEKATTDLAAAKEKLAQLTAQRAATVVKKDNPEAAVDALLDKATEKKAAPAAEKPDAVKPAGDKPPEDKELTAAQAAFDKAELAVPLAARKVVTAQASRDSVAARVAAEQAKYAIVAGADAAALALAAGKSENQVAVCQLDEAVLVAEQALTAAQRAIKPDDEKTKAAATEAEKKLADARAKLAAAQSELAKDKNTYQPLGTIYAKTSTGRRLAFARWLIDRQNPLAARVAVNHVWLRHFGSPLVDNMFDFGLRSPAARNQPLLDWLAVEFMEHGWKMKDLHRLIVTSNAYRMQSTIDERVRPNVALDADNRHLWRMNARRLEAELVRDAVLHAAGYLDTTMGGPDLDPAAGLTSRRRSIYFRHAYEKQMKFLELFDGASVGECYRRGESIVPQQALAMANSSLSLANARLLTKRVWNETGFGPDADRLFVAAAFEQTLARAATDAEMSQCLAFIEEQATLLADPAKLTAFAGGEKSQVEPDPDPRKRARESLVHVLLNHNDFVTIR